VVIHAREAVEFNWYHFIYPRLQIFISVRPTSFKSVLDMMTDTEPRAKKANPEDSVETRLVRELDDGGFINRLYQR
jgi:hypothetical protein